MTLCWQIGSTGRRLLPCALPLGIALALLSVGAPAFPQNAVEYPSFDAPSGLAANGSARFVEGVARLTSGPWQSGSIFTAQPVDVRGFDTTFTCRITPVPGLSTPPGDGLTFTLQGNTPYVFGGWGGYLGYAGIARSLALKIDIFQNWPDPSWSTTGLFFNGQQPMGGAALPDGISLLGDVIEVTLVYDGHSRFAVGIRDLDTGQEWSNLREGLDIPAIVGGPMAYAGFTSGTGASYALHDILTWDLAGVIAADDRCEVEEGRLLSVPAPGILANDYAPGGAALAAAVVTPPAHAERFDLWPNGAFTYLPARGFTGVDSFTYKAANPYGAAGPATVTITVTAGNHPPLAQAGPDQVVEMSSPTGTSVSLNGSASSDPDGDALAYAWDLDGDGVTDATTPAARATYGLGTHVATLAVTDPSGARSTDSVSVTVVDTTPPVISIVTASPAVLWPANGKMVDVALSVKAADRGDPAPVSRIVEVTCDEPAAGGGADWEITGDLTLRLRARRTGSGSRTYTLRVECADASGNRATATVDVVVPHDRGKR